MTGISDTALHNGLSEENLRIQLGMPVWRRQPICRKRKLLIRRAADESQRWTKLCELNVIEQVNNVSNTTIVHDAWKRGHELTLHGWIYSLQDGLLRDLHVSIANLQEASSIYDEAIAALWC